LHERDIVEETHLIIDGGLLLLRLVGLLGRHGDEFAWLGLVV
jgi:hypothetical protein